VSGRASADYLVTDLGTLGGSVSDASGINDRGQVVGSSEVAGDKGSHAFLFIRGHMTDLGALGGDDTYGYAINNKGQVVGAIHTNFVMNYAPFLYSNGTVDLSSLPGVPSAINDSGQIVGRNWSFHAYLMTPQTAPEPGALTLAVLGAFALASSCLRFWRV
jgi:probable HAF family extracellular repeat protein